MTCITTCAECGALYEEYSEEEANSPNRQCRACYDRKENNYWRNMSWQERQGWMRAQDEGCD